MHVIAYKTCYKSLLAFFSFNPHSVCYNPQQPPNKDANRFQPSFGGGPKMRILKSPFSWILTVCANAGLILTEQDSFGGSAWMFISGCFASSDSIVLRKGLIICIVWKQSAHEWRDSPSNMNTALGSTYTATYLKESLRFLCQTKALFTFFICLPNSRTHTKSVVILRKKHFERGMSGFEEAK